MTKKIGRNEPCPCGSGKKYKNCCLRKNNLVDFTRSILQKEIEPLRKDLADYILSMSDQLKNAFEAFNAQTFTDFETMLEKMQETTILGAFLEWFLFDYSHAPGTTPFIEYSKKQQKEYRTISQQQLREWVKIPFSLYQVKEINNQDEYILEDIFTGTTLTFYSPEIGGAMVKEDYLILRALPAGNSHVHLFSVFPLSPMVAKSTHMALKVSKSDAVHWQEYLKEKGTVFLKLIQDKEYDTPQKIEEKEISGIDIDKASDILHSLNLIREQFGTKLKILKGFTLLQACWEPDIQDEFLEILNTADLNGSIKKAYQLDEELLNISNWDNTSLYNLNLSSSGSRNLSMSH